MLEDLLVISEIDPNNWDKEKKEGWNIRYIPLSKITLKDIQNILNTEDYILVEGEYNLYRIFYDRWDRGNRWIIQKDIEGGLQIED